MTKLQEIEKEMDETISSMMSAHTSGNMAAFSALKTRLGNLGGDFAILQVRELFEKHGEGEIF